MKLTHPVRTTVFIGYVMTEPLASGLVSDYSIDRETVAQMLVEYYERLGIYSIEPGPMVNLLVRDVYFQIQFNLDIVEANEKAKLARNRQNNRRKV